MSCNVVSCHATCWCCTVFDRGVVSRLPWLQQYVAWRHHNTAPHTQHTTDHLTESSHHVPHNISSHHSISIFARGCCLYPCMFRCMCVCTVGCCVPCVMCVCMCAVRAVGDQVDCQDTVTKWCAGAGPHNTTSIARHGIT